MVRVLFFIFGFSSVITKGVTFNLDLSFGGSSTFSSDAVAYLVAHEGGSALSTLTTVSNYSIPEPETAGAFFSTGDIIGDYVVLYDALTTVDFGGGNLGFTLTNTTIDTSLVDPDIVAGTDLGIVIVDGGVIYAYSGSDVPNSDLGGDVGWEVPNDAATNSLVDLTSALGGSLALPGDLSVIGAVQTIPEPTSSILSALAVIFFTFQRRR